MKAYPNSEFHQAAWVVFFPRHGFQPRAPEVDPYILRYGDETSIRQAEWATPIDPGMFRKNRWRYTVRYSFQHLQRGAN